MTFDDARATLAAATGLPVAYYSWENDETFCMAVDYGEVLPPFRGPEYLVDKSTGEVREAYGMLGYDPVPNLRPINNPPD